MEKKVKRHHPLYEIYKSIKARCYSPNSISYPRYGARGIKMCDRWFNDFWAFADDMSPRPNGYTIDRINNDGDYSPENCRWLSRKEQASNRSNTIIVEVNGVKDSLKGWAQNKNIEYSTLRSRYHKGLRGEELFDVRKDIKPSYESLETKLALSEKKLDVAIDFIEAVHDYDQEFISDYCLEKIKEIEEME